MKILVLLAALAMATQVAAGEKSAYRELNPNSTGTFHMDSSGLNKKEPQNIEPLFSRAHEIINGNDFSAERCAELKEITLKLLNFWINTDYEVRRSINEVRSTAEKKCGKI
ncbi:MAG TPA: hypothetical protein VK452_00605 [Dissulfurispiraceae bacterium]|nr:hypothetical protein [Dissulfurispiraceae bacterium]